MNGLRADQCFEQLEEVEVTEEEAYLTRKIDY
jgi:hypothetical protein